MVSSGQSPITKLPSSAQLAMDPEPTTLATVAKLIAETLQVHYAVDPGPVLESVGISMERLDRGGARFPWAKMQELWSAAVSASGDPCFGLCVGRSVRPTTFHAVGFAWLASSTLLEALQRLSRYFEVISTVPLKLVIATEGDSYVAYSLPTSIDIRPRPHQAAIDATMAAVLQLCRLATNAHFRPQQVELAREDAGHLDDYVRAFEAPVRFAAGRDAYYFETAALDAQLPGNDRELARANDRVAEHYLAVLDPQRVSSEVKRLLIDLLPTGQVNACTVANRLNMSKSTLQRRLRTERTTYKDIAEDTKRTLAIEYVRQRQLSLSEIAYLLGFSDQSNLSRAFKRWTDTSPGVYRSRALNSLRGES